MTVLLRKGRVRGSQSSPQVRAAGSSVREVCLLGLARNWAAGDRVSWSGRAYHVASAQPHANGTKMYAHLARAATE
jgi:hypothetical protein